MMQVKACARRAMLAAELGAEPCLLGAAVQEAAAVNWHMLEPALHLSTLHTLREENDDYSYNWTVEQLTDRL